MNELYDKLNEIALRDAEITEIELHKPMNTKEQWQEEFSKLNLDWENTKSIQQLVDFIRETREQAYKDGYSAGLQNSVLQSGGAKPQPLTGKI